MTTHAVNGPMERGMDAYHIIRHLFNQAMQSSLTDKQWTLSATFSDPGRTMLTEYQHAESGDLIKCQSFDYLDGVYRKHIFTFRQDVDADSGDSCSAGEANAGDNRAGQPIPNNNQTS